MKSKPDGCTRLISWNVCERLAVNLDRLAELDVDLAIIGEAPDEASIAASGLGGWSSYVWGGGSARQSLAVLGFGDTVVERHTSWDSTIEYAVPVRVSGAASFDIVGVWAQHVKSGPDRGPHNVRRLLDAYDDLVLGGECVVAGDFNEGAKWDTGNPRTDFRPIVDRLAASRMTNVYHARSGLEHGDPAEQPTFWMNRNIEKPHHIDYCFIPNAWLDRVEQFQIGTHPEFGDRADPQSSDHAPLVLDILGPWH